MHSWRFSQIKICLRIPRALSQKNCPNLHREFNPFQKPHSGLQILPQDSILRNTQNPKKILRSTTRAGLAQHTKIWFFKSAIIGHTDKAASNPGNFLGFLPQIRIFRHKKPVFGFQGPRPANFAYKSPVLWVEVGLGWGSDFWGILGVSD